MIPACSYVYADARLETMQPIRNMNHKRVAFYAAGVCDGFYCKMGVPIACSPGPEKISVAATGDFCITSQVHSFVPAIVLRRKPKHTLMFARTTPLPRKRIFPFIFGTSTDWGTFTAQVRRGDTISLKAAGIHKMLLLLCVKRTTIYMGVMQAHLLRSVIEGFGYNLICMTLQAEREAGEFRVAWRRHKVAPIVLERVLTTQSDCRYSFSPANPRGWYPAAGFYHSIL